MRQTENKKGRAKHPIPSVYSASKPPALHNHNLFGLKAYLLKFKHTLRVKPISHFITQLLLAGNYARARNRVVRAKIGSGKSA